MTVLDEVDVFVQVALERLPERFRPALASVEVVVDDEHPDGHRGFYEGVPLTARTSQHARSRVSIFRRPLAGATYAAVERVLLHELGHHFGLTDKEMP